MNNLIGILIVLFICYCLGWLISFVVLLTGSKQSRFYMSIAHAYAILLLVITAQFSEIEFAEILYVLSFFDFLALVVFLSLYVRAENRRHQSPKEIIEHRFINSNEN